ncbi:MULTISPECIES: TetR/AcrR family transcriptional regulator [unclassified Paenibacillus]|uniref:TetR/AcrR family transcriptional regulator n=1 Tax=unclassified Paenibacillus TaxID=185978 RepID=UPI002405F77D|nr:MULTISPECIES: TetR/AcrR family transcriptional regulator [unclassified Paenibacillus]MDF9843975.1 AcrR family transcriptional regulator [Paenibacillus sp. PastF-2]MDF9850580.1 AcrR family transcriptional regulator [Paenibacillus sp. PastM-2]MDF9856306.1 AcrR family transcriptional regulator [Paenibacillus sp. PastF-1]MDH6481465.1 AcrR family transcriptional regulator [Paenibacillus sp. PastH-2]MDH6509779.1 AcrR family transcriptional regulator [Paenibacillus sp. PastM-3]
MKQKPYHHGDLRNTLIETGIELINEEGLGGFSLRKVAAKCGVSHAAPYSHFKDVQQLLAAMADHVTEQFTVSLQASVEGQEDPLSAMGELGTAYIAFFEQHPAYLPFLFFQSGITIQVDGGDEGLPAYPPFAVFRTTAYRLFRSLGLPPERDGTMLMAYWSLVHGVASLLSSSGVRYSGNWQEVWQVILQSGGTENETDRA